MRVSVHVCVCACVGARARVCGVRERERGRVCVCACARTHACVCAREYVFVRGMCVRGGWRGGGEREEGAGQNEESGERGGGLAKDREKLLQAVSEGL
jgi:hypothetical protein